VIFQKIHPTFLCTLDETQDTHSGSAVVQLIRVAHQISSLDTGEAFLLRDTFPAGFEIGEQHLTIDEFIESLSLKIDQHFNEIFFLFYK